MSLTVNQPLQLSAAALGTPGQFDKLIYSYKNLNKQNDKICVIFLWLNILQRQTFTGIRTTKNFLLGIIWPLRQHPMAANWQYYTLIQQMAVLTLALPLTQ